MPNYFVREKNDHPISFDQFGYLTDQVTNEKGVMLLPEVEIKQYRESPFHKWLRENIWKLMNRFDKDSYYKSTKPYQFDTNKAWKTGEFDNFWLGNDRLQSLGLTKTIKDGKPHYFYPNPQFEKEDDDAETWYDFIGDEEKSLKYKKELQGCAANANRINSMLKMPTAGHAWTRHGIYGDSDIVVNPYIDKSSFPWYTFGKPHLKAGYINRLNSDYVEKNIDKHDLNTGDIVDMGYSSTKNYKWALDDGDSNRANTHTGVLLRTGNRKQDTYVIHYMGNGIRVDPIGDLLRHKNDLRITGIRRPGTYKHQYK